MTQLITLSRAARLVGVTRTTLQQQIRDGELTTFEGQLDLSELLRVYPQTKVEDSAMIERADRLIEHALSRVVRDQDQLPDAEVLATRVTALSHELGTANHRMRRYDILMQQLQDYLRKLAAAEAGPTQGDIGELRDWLDSNLSKLARGVDDDGELYATDMLLRVMAAQVHLYPSGHEFFVLGNDNLLEAGLRAGLALDYGCSDGSCGRCRARLRGGMVKPVRRQRYRLSAGEQAAGDILMCCNTAVTDVRLETAETTDPADIEPQRLSAQVAVMERIEDHVLLLALRPVDGARLRYLAGQSAWLVGGDGQRARYPIASCPCDEHRLEFHIRAEDDDGFARGLFDGTGFNQILTVEGPTGEFVLDAASLRSIVFVAWDIGFAPIKSLIEQALALDAAESLHLFRVHTRGELPYLHNRCRAWADALENFHYTHQYVDARAQGDDAEARTLQAKVFAAIAASHFDVAALDFYIAAPAGVLAEIRRYLATRGVSAAQVRGFVSEE